MRKVNPFLQIVIFLLGIAVINYVSSLLAAFVNEVSDVKQLPALVYMVSLVVGIGALVFYGRQWFRVNITTPPSPPDGLRRGGSVPTSHNQK